MSNSELLSIYLQDHHATSSGAVELVRRMIDSNSDNVFGPKIESLAEALIEMRGHIEEVMDAVGVSSSPVKEAGIWLSEKLGRLKLNGRIVSYSPLSRVVEFEGMVMAMGGQVRLWKTLKIASQSDQRLDSFDFDGLIDRARKQVERVESMHRQAVEVAFVESSED